MGRRRSNLDIGYVGGLKEESTAFAGAGLLVELYRESGVSGVAERALPQKRSPKGLRQCQMLEAFILLSALGGECLDDMKRLREDEGLAALLGCTPPAPETARQWLDRFHDDELMSERPVQGSFLPAETTGLAGLREVNKRVIEAYVEAVKPKHVPSADPSFHSGQDSGRALSGAEGKEVTLDVDAHLVETSKANALYCYEGHKAYQPMEVEWAETGLLLSDEFREGNVPASKDIRRMVDEAYEALPIRDWKVRVRSDSAAYEGQDSTHIYHFDLLVSFLTERCGQVVIKTQYTNSIQAQEFEFGLVGNVGGDDSAQL